VITRLVSVLAVLGAALPSGGSTAAVQSAWTERPATYGVHVTDDLKVTMSDGTVLRVNVYRPANPDGTPVQRRFPARHRLVEGRVGLLRQP
jgi:uncharacterized protein